MTTLITDQKHIWHPLTQHKTSSAPVAIARAKGAVLYGEDGKEYLDGIASWYTSLFGHCHPFITERVTAQMQQLDQIMFTGFTHKPATDLAESLFKILPSNQAKMFFNDNGSTAVEAGIKMALQYHHNKGKKRNVLIAFEDGFHGDTFGAMSASGLSVYNGPFNEFLIKVERIATPQEDTIDDILKRLEEIVLHNDCAAFVFEPLVQGAAGMKMHEVAGLNKILAFCKQHDIITIADEVMTGFGKTGTHFASLQLDVYPDIMCLSKALTAGLLPMSLTTCSQHIFDNFLSDEIAKGFFHAHTYSGNPLACAAAIASIELLQSEEMQDNLRRITERHTTFAKALSKNSKAQNIRVKGMILAFELSTKMERYGNLRYELYQFFMDRDVCLRPLGNTIYVLPPLVTTNEQLAKIYGVIEEALEAF
ncbi:adenosylmethionine--8-amino-7-oxononanoate transaminase [Dokdonia sinensis]|uniref:Adenosylmethionine-8-amino-7-oxononanoate aminotransferase n=1 Tax=Dokdonia sinensis TaxID=2479847 RepID=A0A3M0FUP6_9FLAO|nr:adenosylmethionine--8-amino-7-oxononanoate transaminase [Dokdonia sinensis]RMB56414.1 adenosylmethionine--8-amino-7-oxononanoate transaminase [Dokdonia sinensis]